jgi:effector-binding domain-containing protein
MIAYGAVILGVVVLLGGNRLSAAQILLPMNPIGQVWTKHVPFFHGIVRKSEKDPLVDIETVYFDLHRFVALQRMDKIEPIVIEFPDMDWHPNDPRPALIYLPLPGDREYEHPRDLNLAIEVRGSSTVASVSFRGAYTWDNIMPRILELREWLKRTGAVTAGSPRLLLYHFRALRPDWWREAEVQIPIRGG